MPVPDDEECLLQWVYRRLLTTAETDARRLRRINAKQLRLGIEQSEREARVDKLKRKQHRVIQRLQGFIAISNFSSSDGSDGSDGDPPPATDRTTVSATERAKGRRGSGEDPSLFQVFSCSLNLSVVLCELWLSFDIRL